MLEGKIAVVTGGSRGIGRAISQRLAAMGALVYINYVSRPDAAEETCKLIKDAGGKAESIQFNVADGGQVQEAFKKIVADAGSIDILVNNAGITRDGFFKKMDWDQWHAVLSTNLDSAFNMTRPVIEDMLDQKWGRVINISSVNGEKGQMGQSNYSAAKAGIHGFTKALAQEGARNGVTVNTISPGYILTPMVAKIDQSIQDKITAGIPVGRMGQPSEIGRAVAFLAAEEAGYITGSNLSINGGQHMY